MLIQKETGNFRGAAFIEFNNNLALQVNLTHLKLCIKSS